MVRYLSAATLLVVFPLNAFAQLQLGTQPIGSGMQGAPAGNSAGWRMPGPLPVTPGGPKYPCAGGVCGGFTPAVPRTPTVPGPGFPFSGVWLGGYGFGGYDPFAYGPGYGYAPGTSYSLWAPSYEAPPTDIRPPVGTLAIGDEFPATLVLEFPAAAEIWVDGQKGEGKPTTEWTLTSPAIRTGTEFAFKVKARWTAGGKTYEYERVVNVASGNRSRALVLVGNEIKE